jgi:hypothetical protein
MALSACNYLDVVPDNTLTLDDIFVYREDAYRALSKCYGYLPSPSDRATTLWLRGDDYQETIDEAWSTTGVHGYAYMRSGLSTSNILFGKWADFYKAITACNILLDNIHKVYDMQELEKREWRGQAKFLKAYYHWLLMERYGPICISDELLATDYDGPKLKPYREKIDDCFDYIITTMDEALPDLRAKKEGDEQGQLDLIAALAIKARILLFRASPFYSDNMEVMGDFKDPRDGKPFFPVDASDEVIEQKWKDAFAAVDTAINFALAQGKDLYVYTKEPYSYDVFDLIENPKLQTVMDLRMLIVDPWNKEMIWAHTAASDLQSKSGVLLPEGYTGVTNSLTGTEQRIGGRMKSVERYYSENGVPMAADRTITGGSLDIVQIPGVSDPAYTPYKGILQAGARTVNMFLQREPRFYAHLFFPGSYLRQHKQRLNVTMMYKEIGGKTAFSTYAYPNSGVGVQKFIHPNTTSGGGFHSVSFPTPVIRLADLFLMRAEIRNRLYGPSQLVYDDINRVRRRAGLPDVEKVYADPAIVTGAYLNRHTTKAGLHDIIIEERDCELKFEGASFVDNYRYTKCESVYLYSAGDTQSRWRFNMGGCTTLEEYVDPQWSMSCDEIKFRQIDYLLPIALGQLDVDPNLVQSPGW